MDEEYFYFEGVRYYYNARSILDFRTLEREIRLGGEDFRERFGMIETNALFLESLYIDNQLWYYFQLRGIRISENNDIYINFVLNYRPIVEGDNYPPINIHFSLHPLGRPNSMHLRVNDVMVDLVINNNLMLVPNYNDADLNVILHESLNHILYLTDEFINWFENTIRRLLLPYITDILQLYCTRRHGIMQNHRGGTDYNTNKYYLKYLKYKQKYLELKNNL
jgi:hypothetical protein